MATVTRSKSTVKDLDIKELFQQELHDYLASRNFKEVLREALRDSIKEALKEAVEDVVKPLRDEIDHLKKELADVREKANENEQYSRRCNIRIFGLDEKSSENCPEEVSQFCKKELGVDVGDDIDRAHRVGKMRSAGEQPRARPMIVKFKSYSTRRSILKNKSRLRGKNIFINEDLTKVNQDLLMSTRRLCQGQNLSVFSMDGNVFLKNRSDDTGRIHRIKCTDDALPHLSR